MTRRLATQSAYVSAYLAERIRVYADTCTRAALADPHLLVIDVQTTGLHAPYALQIAATDRHGRRVLDHTLNPQAVISAAATAPHGLTTHDIATAATFSALLPRITDALHGPRCLAYNMPFDQHVIERELNRPYSPPSAVQRWLRQCRWECRQSLKSDPQPVLES
ncbi:3'-5' exonuclease [Streptomyces sp. Li-HN-5-11]|uniref:3'-5' exonuclease n=1 Tax=Streptomyces sp. Li-HN-5-11 TaxID=3075432 RepID=UPI0028B09EE0|nr:3'-5' exonuclease [Streptomyces sp. Li-HN-5-11]WNM33721.1 3'-5' exonuclease [Streptomyces sp. Li-HN-5-11]